MPDQPSIRGLRVLMTADAVGGVFSYAMTLSRELGRRGADVLMACMGPSPSLDQRREADSVPRLRLVHADYDLEWMDSPWSSVDRAGEWLLRLSREFQPDVLHLNGYSHAALPFAAPTLIVAHSCVVSWWRAVFGTDPPETYDVYRERVACGLQSTQMLVAPSTSMLRSVREQYGYGGPGLVIFNGAAPSDYFRRPKRPFFLAAGRLWDHAKNLGLILEAAPELPWPIDIVGDGAPQADTARVHRTGRLAHPALARLMGEASVFLHPARYEPFGLAPLEAALSGAALVLGRIESLQEIWGSAALYVSPDDPAELVAAATKLADDPLLRHALSAKAEARARHFSSELMADRYSALYLDSIHQNAQFGCASQRAGAGT